MRAICLVLLSLCLVAPTLGFNLDLAHKFEKYIMEGFEEVSHVFGAVQLIREAEGLFENIVHWPENGYLSDPDHILDTYTTIAKSLKSPEKYDPKNIITCNPGAKSDYFKFAPLLAGIATIGNTIHYSAPCFTENSITLNKINDNTVELVHVVGKPTGRLCSDVFFYATTQNYHLSNIFFHGTHKTKFAGLTESQMKEFQTIGITVFHICDSLAHIFPDIFKTVLLFAGGISTNPHLPFIGSHPTFWMEAANVDFIKHATGYEWKVRKNTTVVELDPSEIQSGDFIAVTRMDGLDQIIEWGAGSHSGHSVVALWVENELYFLESQAAWYWPRKDIQMNPYKTWLKWANNAGYSVTHLPLKKEAAKSFNATAAYEYFKTVEGTPYGYHNFLFGWIDTEADSYPPLLSPEIFPPILSILERFIPDVGIIFNQAINFRFNTTNLTIPELAQVAHEKNLTWGQVLAMPEKDEWVYDDGYNMVCSSFVVAIWRAGGLFGDLEIQATEFTPRDAYSMSFIDPKPTLSQACLDNDPHNPYCQIMGKYLMEFPQISTVEPYAHMNERCPSRVTDSYFRPQGC